MTIQKISFKVSMDEEQKALKNFKVVELEVEMDVPMDIKDKYALKAFTIEIQGQIRPNWTEFIKGEYPRTIDLGHNLFPKKTARTLTLEEKKAAVKAELANLSPMEKLERMHKDGFITDEQYETLKVMQA